MSSETIAVGQNLPLETYLNSAQNGRRNAGQSGGMSFQNTLDRQRLHQTQLQMVNPPQSPASSGASNIRQAPSNAAPSAPPSEPLPAPYQEQTQELLGKVNQGMPSNNQFEQKLMQQYQDYQQFKTEQQAQPKAAQQPPIPNSAPADDKQAPSQYNPTAAMNQVFADSARSAQQQAGMETQNLNRSPNPPSNGQFSPKTQQTIAEIHADLARAEAMAKSQNAPDAQAAMKQSQQTQNQADSQANQHPGVGDAVGGFFQDLFSAMTLGFYRPPGEPAPSGIGRVFDPLQKLVYEAPVEGLLVGVPRGIYNDVSGKSGEGKTDQATAAENTQAPQSPAEEKPASRSSNFSHASKPWLYRNRA